MPSLLSARLACCAAMVRPGAAVADVGTDHGYLAIYLLQQQIASQVIAADLRAKPLEKARQNAQAWPAWRRKFGFISATADGSCARPD